MNLLTSIVVFSTIAVLCGAPPVKENAIPEENDNKEGLENYMEYHRYLTEVVAALESDADFKQKLQGANEDDIKSGKIANELKFVSRHVRTKLDEIKRIELDRLKELFEKKKVLTKKLATRKETYLKDGYNDHVDDSNVNSFEIEDLKKLIAKVQVDLAEADKIRKEQFKEYELQKEFEKQQKLNSSSPEEREKIKKHFEEEEQKHKNHEKLHEPGHKAQLEEVWHEQDKMTEEFDPKTFFLMHDMDSNGLWDQNEVKALFIKELNKMYENGAPEDDINERIEEMERMRESVFREVDTNNDGFIDFSEFLAQTKKEAFREDHGWNALDEQKPYTNEELNEYISRHQQMPYQQPYPNQNIPPVYHAPPPQYQPIQGNDINQQVPNSVPHYSNQVYQQGQHQPLQQPIQHQPMQQPIQHQPVQQPIQQQYANQQPNVQQVGQQHQNPQPISNGFQQQNLHPAQGNAANHMGQQNQGLNHPKV